MDKIQKLLIDICGENYTTEWRNLNYRLVPVTRINATIGNEQSFNELYVALYESDYKPIERTNSGGISIKASYRLHNHYNYDIRTSNNCCEITVSSAFLVDNKYEMRTYRVQFRINNTKLDNNQEAFVSGRQADKKVKDICKKHNIDLTKYEVTKEDGIKYKNEITPPNNNVYDGIPQVTYDKVCHLDFHKFYPSGIAEMYPEFKKAFEELNQLAKEDKKYKTIMDAWTGYGRSKYSSYKYAKLIKDGINHAYEKFYEVMEALKKDRKILFANTDGIWYAGDEWHGIYEGEGLGCWSNDHINCQLRFKSAGSYEFIEDGKYYPVVKGCTLLDKYKSREEWEWGDIFRLSASTKCWYLKEGEGIVWQTIE